MNPARTSEHRPFRAAAIALLFATGLAACGGGSSSGPNPFVPAPVACDSASASSADGFTIGMCASTATSVFVDVGSAVQMPLPTDSYNLTLNFPVALDANDGSTGFTAANLTESGWDRNVLGALRGVSYENPLNAKLIAPYVALTDFHWPAYLADNPPWLPPELQYVRFGTWEKVPVSTEGFVGPWYEGFSATTTVVNFWPNGEAANRLYRGYVVGVIGPDEDGSTYLTRLRSFSAPVEIEVDGNGRIVRAGFGTVVMPYYDSNSQLKFEPLPIDAVRLRQNATDTPGGLLTGPVESAEGPDADLVDGRFEAKYFGVSGDYSYELAGRFRFRTSNGLIAIGSFGAQFVPPPPG